MKKYFYYILLLMGLAGIIDTIIALRYVPFADLGVLLPAITGIIFLFYSGFKIKTNKFIIKKKNFRKVVRIFIILGLLIFTILEVCIFAAAKIVDSKEANISYVLVLGCAVDMQGTPSITLINRLDKAFEYFEKHPDVDIIVSGGKGLYEPLPEAQVMANYLIKKGVSPEQIIIEDRSQSTMENFKFSRQKLAVDAKELKILVVTSDFHIFRSKILARRNGFKPYGYTSKTPGIIAFNCYLREFFALIKSILFDY